MNFSCIYASALSIFVGGSRRDWRSVGDQLIISIGSDTIYL